MCTPTPRSAASPAAAANVSSVHVNAACTPTIPRPPARMKRSFSASPRRAPSGPCRSVTPYAPTTRTPTSAHASAITSRLPSIAFGLSLWSTIPVVPHSSASRAPSRADARSMSRSSAASSRHQICSRIWAKSVGRLRRSRHAAGERRVEVVVRAHQSPGHGAHRRPAYDGRRATSGVQPASADRCRLLRSAAWTSKSSATELATARPSTASRRRTGRRRGAVPGRLVRADRQQRHVRGRRRPRRLLELLSGERGRLGAHSRCGASPRRSRRTPRASTSATGSSATGRCRSTPWCGRRRSARPGSSTAPPTGRHSAGDLQPLLAGGDGCATMHAEALTSLLQPLFTTSFLIDAWLADEDMFGAEPRS